MNTTRLLLALAMSVAVLPLLSQGWIYTFPGQHPGNITADAAGGFFCSTRFNGFLKRLDAEGKPLWQTDNQGGEIFSGLAFDPATGGCYALREPSTVGVVSLLHFDALGNRDGQWPLGPDMQTNDLWRPRLARHPEGGFIVAGVFSGKLSVVRVSDAGDILWKKNYAASGGTPDQKFRGLLSVGPTGWIALAAEENTGFFDVNVLFLLSPDGNVRWYKQFYSSELNCNSLVATSDSSVVLTGYNNNTALVRKYGADQILAFETALPAQIQIPGGSPLITLAGDGGFMLLTSNNPQADYQPVMAKLSPGGAIAWSKRLWLPGFTDKYYSNFYDLITTPDGDFAAMGEVSTSTSYEMLVLRTDAAGRIFSNRIAGHLFTDDDKNCLPDSGETPKTGWTVRLGNTGTGIAWFAATDSSGHYEFEVDTGVYTVQAIPPNFYWLLCSPGTDVVIDAPETDREVDFAAQRSLECPFLEVDLGAPFLRRCVENTYAVRFCNTGTAAADSAYVVLQTDPYQQLTWAARPFVPLDAHTFRFDLGRIDPDSCGQFLLKLYVDCDSTTLGQTLCPQAHIFPDSLCIQSANYSGASLAVSGDCTSGGVRFQIKNEGTQISSAGLRYRVIADGALAQETPFQLPASDALTLLFPADGRTWRLEADQEPNHPGQSQPSATVEGCGQNAAGAASVGFVSQFGEDDNDPFVSVDCQPITGSFDPNDKTGYPLGYGPEHRIEPGQSLEYRIRFQNTGTDTAFTVVVRDTLPATVDAAGIVPGAASHPYRFEMAGPGILKFTFENILLPDSNRNEPASHGFIKFRIPQRPDVPPGTVIENRAAIYFDFNAPVLTNTTQHQVGHISLPLSASGPEKARRLIRVVPNPGRATDVFRVEGLPDDVARCLLVSVTGQVLFEQAWTRGKTFSPGRSTVAPGVYRLQFFDRQNRLCGVGKLVLVP